MRNERLHNDKMNNQKRCAKDPHTWDPPHGFLSAMKPEKGVVDTMLY